MQLLLILILAFGLIPQGQIQPKEEKPIIVPKETVLMFTIADKDIDAAFWRMVAEAPPHLVKAWKDAQAQRDKLYKEKIGLTPAELAAGGYTLGNGQNGDIILKKLPPPSLPKTPETVKP